MNADWLVSSQLQAAAEAPASTWIPAKKKWGWVLMIWLHIFHRPGSVPLFPLTCNCSFPSYPTLKRLPDQESTFSMIFILDNICVCSLWFLLPLIWHTRPWTFWMKHMGKWSLQPTKLIIHDVLILYVVTYIVLNFWVQKFRHGSFYYNDTLLFNSFTWTLIWIHVDLLCSLISRESQLHFGLFNT